MAGPTTLVPQNFLYSGIAGTAVHQSIFLTPASLVPIPCHHSITGITGTAGFSLPWYHWHHSIFVTMVSMTPVFSSPWPHWPHSISTTQHHSTHVSLTLATLALQYFPYPGVTGLTAFPLPWHHWPHSIPTTLAPHY